MNSPSSRLTVKPGLVAPVSMSRGVWSPSPPVTLNLTVTTSCAPPESAAPDIERIALPGVERSLESVQPAVGEVGFTAVAWIT